MLWLLSEKKTIRMQLERGGEVFSNNSFIISYLK